MAKRDPIINGRRASEKCATCAHKWGNHGQKEPHKCCRLDCNCPEFREVADEGDW